MTLLDLPAAAVPPFLDVDGLPCASGDPDAWFPSGRGVPDDIGEVLCDGCPALIECRAFALDEHVEYGIWGGLTEQQRRDHRNPPPQPSPVTPVSPVTPQHRPARRRNRSPIPTAA